MNKNQISFLLVFFLCTLINLNSQEYQLVWEDNFDGNQLNSDFWSYETTPGVWNWGSNQELQHYRAENVAVGPDGEGNNALIITAKREDYGGYKFTSGRIKTERKVAVQFGKIEARIKLPVLENGLWPAFWMLGVKNTWPSSGEIDIMEAGHGEGIQANTQNRTFNGALHWQHGGNYAGYGPQHTAPAGANLYDYNLFTCVWTPESIQMFFNDETTPYFSMNVDGDDAEEFRDWAHYFILNLAVGGSFPGITNPNDITSPFPAQMFVDYVKVYQREGEGALYTSTDSSLWDTWFGDGGAGNVVYDDGQLAKVTITSAGWAAHSVQLFRDNMDLPDGNYLLTFKARANTPRNINVNLGKGLSVAPWFVAFMDPAPFALTTNWQDFSLPIAKSNAINDGKLVFEMGEIAGGTLVNVVYIDAVSLAPASSTGGVLNDDSKGVVAYPNPAANSFAVDLIGNESQILVFDMAGVILYEENLSGNSSVNVNCKGWKPGVYFIVVVDDKGNRDAAKLIVK